MPNFYHGKNLCEVKIIKWDEQKVFTLIIYRKLIYTKFISNFDSNYANLSNYYSFLDFKVFYNKITSPCLICKLTWYLVKIS